MSTPGEEPKQRLDDAAMVAAMLFRAYGTHTFPNRPSLRRAVVQAAASIIAETASSAHEDGAAVPRIKEALEALSTQGDATGFYSGSDEARSAVWYEKDFIEKVEVALDARLACRRT